VLTYREITEILKMVDASECEEFILELEGMKLVVRRGGAGTGVSSSSSVASTPAISNSAASTSVGQSQLSPSDVNTPGAAVQNAGVPMSSTGIEMRSPMVGTFYRRPSPSSPAFVEVDSSN